MYFAQAIRHNFETIISGEMLGTPTQCHTLVILRDEHGSGLDRTGSGLKPILAGSELDRTAIFSKLANQDWIGLRKFLLF